MEKVKVLEVVTEMQISVADPFVGDKDFVRLSVQSTGGGVNVGRKLFIFDHRPDVLRAAKLIDPSASWEDRSKAEEALKNAVQQPAKVVVVKKQDGEREYFYLNLYPANGQTPTALLSQTSYTGKHNAGFDVREDNALWSWTSESSSRTRCHTKMILVALTDDTHRVIVDSYGYANIGHSDQNLTVIGREIKQMADEDLIIDLEP